MRAAQAFFNYGYDHSEKFLRYVTERQEEEGGTDRVGRFYFYDKPSPAGTVAPNEPFLMTLGAFCMAYMHDAQYRVQADTMYRRFRDEMATSTDQKAVKAYYMALINGLMILDAPSAGDATRGEHKYLTVNTFEEEIGDSGGDVNINVLSDQNWEITVSESWMEPGLSSGSGNESIMIAIDPNPAETFRSGFVILSADSVSSKYIKINQRGNLTRYKISTSIIGSGSIGIEDFAQDYAAGSELEIVAHPLDSFHFDHWSGDTSSFENPLTLVLTEDINITANFSEGMSSGVDYILQAEEATILNNADIENGVFGYTSSGYVRFTQNTSSIEFSGIRTAMGSFSVSIRSYETFSDSSELVVNNVIHKYKLPSTNGAWVETVIPSVTFDTINQIILRNGKQQKLDRIKIIGGSDSSCPVHLKIDGGRILSDSVYEAKSILEVGAFQISQEQHLQFKAPEVLLLPQFSINNGSNVNVVQTNKCLQE